MHVDERNAVRLMRLAGAAVLAIGIALAIVMPQKAVTRNVDGLSGAVVGFELVTTPDEVLGILGAPDHPQRAAAVQAMDRANRVDFLFMLAYPALAVAIVRLLVARGLAPRAATPIVGLLALVMIVGDFIENRQLLVLSQLTDPAAMAEPLARLRTATIWKWAALFLSALTTAPFVWRDASTWRWSAVVFAAAGLLGLCGIVWLPGVEWGANVIGVAWLWSWVHALRA